MVNHYCCPYSGKWFLIIYLLLCSEVQEYKQYKSKASEVSRPSIRIFFYDNQIGKKKSVVYHWYELLLVAWDFYKDNHILLQIWLRHIVFICI